LKSRPLHFNRFCILSVGLLGLLVCAGCSHPPAVKASAPAVEVTTVIQKDVPIYGNWVGTLQGYVNAQIEPHVSGYLIANTPYAAFPLRKAALLEPRWGIAIVDPL